MHKRTTTGYELRRTLTNILVKYGFVPTFTTKLLVRTHSDDDDDDDDDDGADATDDAEDEGEDEGADCDWRGALPKGTLKATLM